MNYDLVYSPMSLKDLDRIWMEVWEASGDLDTADQYIEDLRMAIRKKQKYPKTGMPLIYLGEFSGIYYLPFKAYLAFYRIRNTTVEVGRILFAKSDYMKTLFGKSAYTLQDTDD